MGKRLAFLVMLKYKDVIKYLKGWNIHDGFIWVDKENDSTVYSLDRMLAISDKYLDPYEIFRRDSVIYPFRNELKDCSEFTIELFEFRYNKTMAQTYKIPEGWNAETI